MVLGVYVIQAVARVIVNKGYCGIVRLRLWNRRMYVVYRMSLGRFVDSLIVMLDRGVAICYSGCRLGDYE